MGGVSQDVIDDTKDGDDASLVNLRRIRCEGGGEFGEGGSEGTGRGAAHISYSSILWAARLYAVVSILVM